MRPGDAEQKAEKLELELELWGSGRNPREHRPGASKAAAKVDKSAATGGPTQGCRLNTITPSTAGYGTVRPVVWEDGGGNPASYPI